MKEDCFKCTEKLYQQIQSKLEILFDKNISDNDYNYTNKETPFSSIKRNQLGSYWNLEIKEAIKSNQFGNVIGLLHEYLNRIQEQFEQKEKVSGKSFSDLPKKILYAHEISKEDPLVNEAIKNIVIRYNELGKMFEEQNKNNKKYKPKNYIIKV